jgi:hypothetical protein
LLPSHRHKRNGASAANSFHVLSLYGAANAACIVVVPHFPCCQCKCCFMKHGAEIWAADELGESNVCTVHPQTAPPRPVGSEVGPASFSGFHCATRSWIPGIEKEPFQHCKFACSSMDWRPPMTLSQRWIGWWSSPHAWLVPLIILYWTVPS